MAIEQYGNKWHYQFENDGSVLIISSDFVATGDQLEFIYTTEEGPVVHDFVFDCSVESLTSNIVVTVPTVHDIVFDCSVESETSSIIVDIILEFYFDCEAESELTPITIIKIVDTLFDAIVESITSSIDVLRTINLPFTCNAESLTSNIIVTTPGEVYFSCDILAASDTSNVNATQIIEYTVVTMIGISDTSLVSVDKTIDIVFDVSVESSTSSIEVISVLLFFPDISIESLTSSVVVDLGNVVYFTFDCATESLTTAILSLVIRDINYYSEGMLDTSDVLAYRIIPYTVSIDAESDLSSIDVLLTTLIEIDVVITSESDLADIALIVDRLTRPLIVVSTDVSLVNVVNDHRVEVYSEAISVLSDVNAFISALGVITCLTITELDSYYAIEELGTISVEELEQYYTITEGCENNLHSENTELILEPQDRHFTIPGSIGNWDVIGNAENYMRTLKASIPVGFNYTIADLYAEYMGSLENSEIICNLRFKLGPSNVNNDITVGFNASEVSWWKNYNIKNLELDKWYTFDQIWKIGNPVLQTDSLWIYLVGNPGDYFQIDQVSMKAKLPSEVPNTELNYISTYGNRIDKNKNFNSNDGVADWVVSGNGLLEYDNSDIGFTEDKLVLISTGGPVLEAKLSLDNINIQPSKEYTISALVHIPSGNSQSLVSIKTEGVVGTFNSNRDKLCPAGTSVLHETVIGFAEDVTGSIVIGFGGSQLDGDRLYFNSFSIRENILQGRGLKSFVNYAPLFVSNSETSNVNTIVFRDMVFDCSIETITNCKARGAWKPINYIASPNDLTHPEWIRNRTIHTVDGIIPTVEDASHYAREDSLPNGNLFLYQIKLKKDDKNRASIRMRNAYYQDNEGTRFRYPGLNIDLENGEIQSTIQFPSGYYMSSTPDADGFYLCQVECAIKDFTTGAVYIYLRDNDGSFVFPGDGVSTATRAKNVLYLESTDNYVAFAVEAKSETSSPNVNGVFDAGNNLVQSPNDLTTWWTLVRAENSRPIELVANTLDSSHHVYRSDILLPSNTHLFRAKMKPGLVDWGRLQLNETSGGYRCWFDLANALVGIYDGDLLVVDIQSPDAEGYCLCTIVYDVGDVSGNNDAVIYGADRNGYTSYIGDDINASIWVKDIELFIIN